MEDKKENVGKSSHDNDDGFCDVKDNVIYFYDYVKDESCTKLIQGLHQIDKQNKINKINWGIDIDIPIHLRIKSYGGEVHWAFAVIDTILNCKSPVYTYIDGCAASAGTLISVVGRKRYIGKNATMLIHQLSSGFWGKFNEFQDNQKNLDQIMEQIKELYKDYTNVPHDQLDEILKHDLWWNAKKCLDFGLVDEIE